MATSAPPAICCTSISLFPNGPDWWPTIPPTHSPTNCETCLHARAASRNGELDARRERLRTQWRLAFALREEYNAAIRAAYSGEYRLDASQLMIDATEAVSDIWDVDIPNMLIVDDFQDATLAGFALLEALHNRGTRLLLVQRGAVAHGSAIGAHRKPVCRMRK